MQILVPKSAVSAPEQDDNVNNSTWIGVDAYPDRFSAEAIVGLLASEGVPAYIAADEPIPGLGRNFSVLVPPELVQRALRILKQAPVGENELMYLATGELPGPTGDELER
jgi:hypothetical protein